MQSIIDARMKLHEQFYYPSFDWRLVVSEKVSNKHWVVCFVLTRSDTAFIHKSDLDNDVILKSHCLYILSLIKTYRGDKKSLRNCVFRFILNNIPCAVSGGRTSRQVWKYESGFCWGVKKWSYNIFAWSDIIFCKI